jgi:hypothetical protein
LRQIKRCAKKLGFHGNIEYRHVLGGTGGAQYWIGSSKDEDLLLVFAEAFERNADPQDFSLAAILAHERGHQMIVRQPRLSRMLPKGIGVPSEEILASLLGSLIADVEEDRQALYYKAIFEAVAHGMEIDHAVRLLKDLRDLLEKAI